MPENQSDSSENIKKPTRGRPRNDTSPLTVRMSAAELADLDTWIASNGPPYVTRPEALRQLAQLGIRAQKYSGGEE